MPTVAKKKSPAAPRFKGWRALRSNEKILATDRFSYRPDEYRSPDEMISCALGARGYTRAGRTVDEARALSGSHVWVFRKL